jgi:hypothetical protein
LRSSVTGFSTANEGSKGSFDTQTGP